VSENQKSYERGQVIEIIHSVINKMEGSSDPSPELILSHIAELAETIDRLKKDISETRTQQLQSEDIPGATDELDAVVESTAEATNAIMSACEEIENVSTAMDGKTQSDLMNAVTQIYEACSFQDITGQRITKVVTTLRTIEEKITTLMNTLNAQVGPIQEAAVQQDNRAGDQALLNGPQKADKAVTQDDIDKLLAEFDN